jgi:putative FmdB family regulatory protein
MPIYEYQCKKCGHQTEILQKFSDPPLAKCEACNGRMKKLISQNTFHLKGSGWYVTDYASKSTSSNGTSRSAESEGGSSSSDEKAPKMETKDSSKKAAEKKPQKAVIKPNRWE